MIRAPLLRSGIVVDDWKLPTFRRALDAAGFVIEREVAGPARGVSLLTVLSNDLAALAGVLRAADAQARAIRDGST